MNSGVINGCYTVQDKWREVSEDEWRAFLWVNDLKYSVTNITEPPMARVVCENGDFPAYADVNFNGDKLERFFLREALVQ